MTEIRFYHLQHTALAHALPQILAKALAGGRRAVVKAADEGAVEALNGQLWTFQAESFLPHGSAKDGYGAQQPVWLTAGDDVPNGADLLILTGGAACDDVSAFALCCEMFDGHDAQAVAAARTRWKAYKDAGHQLTYWQQDDRGRWDKKAES